MLRNYLKVTWRNLLRHYSYSLINILGLSISLAIVMIISLWLHRETSFDQHWDQSEQIYRVGIDFFNLGEMAISPPVLSHFLHERPEVTAVTGVKTLGEVTVVVDTKESVHDYAHFVDDGFPDIFNLDVLHGTLPANGPGPLDVVVSHSLAEIVFGRSDVVGQPLTLKALEQTFTIIAVVRTSQPTHLPVNILLRNPADLSSETNWTSAGLYTYVKLKAGKTSEDLDLTLTDIVRREIHPVLGGDQSFEEWWSTGMYRFLPMAISEIYLESNMKFEPSPGGNKMIARIFAGVGILILLLACINFINLSTARATIRAKEVAIRKTLGTSQPQLIFQFLTESVVLCLMAFFISLFLAEWFLGGFEGATGLELLTTIFGSGWHIFYFFVFVILLGIVAGFFPAVYLTHFEPVKVLKGRGALNEKGVVRGVLVVFQFVISISLIIVSIFVYRQLDHIRTVDKGFDTNNLIVVRNVDAENIPQEVLKQEISKLSQVSDVSLLQRVPASSSSSVTSIRQPGMDEDLWIQRFSGDENMISCLGFRLTNGRNFVQDLASDTSAVILNDQAVKALVLEDPLGALLNSGKYRVIGVIDDFNFETMKKSAGPVLLTLLQDPAYVMAVKFSGSNPEPVISVLQTLWDSFGAEKPLDYYFLDENYERMVEKERVLATSVAVFTVFALLISCLGLFGLSSFVAERRVKEIGVRRVLGATIMGVTALLGKDFARPILVAFLISAPISLFIVSEWLSNYAYRIETDPWTFIVSGVVAVIVGLMTVSWTTVRTALRNPVRSLRSE